MSLLLRFLGIGSDPADRDATETVRGIAHQLDSMKPEAARYIAAFAFVLARVAHADFSIDDNELAEMRRSVSADPSISDHDAALVVDIVRSQTVELGGSDNYQVTREFKRISTRSQRLHALRCLYAVAAADGSISATETNEIVSIGEELGFSQPEAMAVGAEWKSQLSVLQGKP